MSDRKRKVTASPAEELLVKKAEKLQQAGFGPDTPGSFDLGADMAAMKEVGMLPPDHEALVIPAQLPVNPMPQPAQPQMPEQPKLPEESQEKNKEPDKDQLKELWMAETNGEVLFNDWIDTKKTSDDNQLSDDPEVRANQIAALLKKIHPNPPNAEMLKSWKQLHGDIFLLNVEGHVFLYRYLKRQEWVQLNSDPATDKLSEHQAEEKLFDRCTLWPQFDQVSKAGMPAGAIPMIVAQVKLQSFFLDPAYVAQLTIKL